MPSRLPTGVPSPRSRDLLIGERNLRAGWRAPTFFRRRARRAPGGDDQLVAVDVEPVGELQRRIVDPFLELAAGELPDRAGVGIGDIDVALGVGGDVVEERGAGRVVLGDDLARLGIDLDQLVDVRRVELAAGQREALGRVHALRPFQRDDLAVGERNLGNEPVAVLVGGIAGDVADVGEALRRNGQRRLRRLQAGRLPQHHRLRIGAGEDRARRHERDCHTNRLHLVPPCWASCCRGLYGAAPARRPVHERGDTLSCTATKS